MGISDFQISGEFLIKENYYNSRTSNDTDTKLGPVTKLDKINKTKFKKFDDDVMSENCDVIVSFFDIWQIWSNPEAGVFKTYVFISSNHTVVTFYLKKNLKIELKNL